MPKKKYDKYTNPEDVQPGSLTPEEISSHSSLLTNKRLDILFGYADAAGIAARTNPCIPTIRDYYSGLMGIYNSIFCLLSAKQNKELAKMMGSILGKIKTLGSESSFVECLQTSVKLDQMYRLLVAYLQMRNYFFRVRVTSVKGIEQALKLLNEGIR